MPIQQEKPMLKVLIDQKNPDGSFKTIKLENGKIEMRGGVVEDNIMERLGYVYDESRYNRDGTRISMEGVTAYYDWSPKDSKTDTKSTKKNKKL